MKTGRISALALALSLGLMTTAEAEDWTGGFVTLGFGNTAIDFRSSTGPGGETPDAKHDDWSPFVAAGYDWSHGNLTFGLVADIDGAQVPEDIVSFGKGFTGESDWFATLRARVGTPVGEKVHVYASGGLAFMGVSSTSEILLPIPSSGTDHQTLTGAAAGLGLDYMLSPGKHLSVEYLHADFGPTEFHDGLLTREPTVDTVRLGYTLRF